MLQLKLTDADSLLRLGEGVDGELDMIWYASVCVGTGIGSDEGEVLGVWTCKEVGRVGLVWQSFLKVTAPLEGWAFTFLRYTSSSLQRTKDKFN